MSLTFGVAIPCYSGHVQYIPSLLENIVSSTVKPNHIVVSCSSWVHNKIEQFEYKDVPVWIWYSTQKLNQATNRNRAASLLNTDLISFFDADDLMHPRRIEFLKQIFEQRPDVSAIYHAHKVTHISQRDEPFWEEPEVRPLPNKVVKDPTAIGIMVQTDLPIQYIIHHGQVTVRSNVFKMIKFEEDWRWYRAEDSVYAATLVAYNIPILYLDNTLSRYIFVQ